MPGLNLIHAADRLTRRALLLRGARSELRTVGAHRVHTYRVPGDGSGPPVVFLHGLGASANSFALVLPPMAKGFGDVWALDLPGNGFSPMPDGGPLSVREHVAVFQTFLRDVVRAPAFLVGNSLGGAMSLFVATESAELVRALALLAPAGARMSEARIAALKQSFAVRSEADARAMTRRLFARPPLPFLLVAGEMRVLFENPAVLRIISEVSAADALEGARLRALSMPTLLVWGREEKLLPYEALDYFRAHLPKHAVIREEAGLGHMPQLEHPRRTLAILRGFARDQRLID